MLPQKNLDRGRYKPLYAQLADILIAYIEENGLKPGDIMPSEHELVNHYQVSQMTVRQALQRLATNGYITRLQGKGTFVAEPLIKEKIQGIQSLEERFATQGLKVSSVLLEARLITPGPLQLKELQLPPGSKTFKVKRLKKLEGRVLGLEARNFPAHMEGFFSKNDLEDQAFVELLRKTKETAVHRIEYQTTSAPVMEIEADMMEVAIDTPVLIQHGIFNTRDDRPIMIGRMVYLPNTVAITYDVKSSKDHGFRLIGRD